MNKVAETAADTSLAGIKTTARLAEVGNGAQLAVYGAGGVPAAVEGVAGLLGGFFVLEAGVYVANEVF